MNHMQEANAIASMLRTEAKPAARRGGKPRMATPSAAHLRVLAFMREFFAENDQLPPVHVISKRFGWSSDSAADWHVQALLRFGRLERNVVGKLRFARPKGGEQ